MTQALSSYLQQGRLSDVLALVQLLAFDDSGYRTEDGMVSSLGGPPASATTWVEVGKAHPEFFRVRNVPDRTIRVALIIRYVIGKVEIGDDEKRPPLAPEFVASLFELAVNLHDKQVQHRDRWKPWLTGLLGAALGAIASFGAAYLNDSEKERAPNPPIVIKMVAPSFDGGSDRR